jgi:ceramide glucosyltransferase
LVYAVPYGLLAFVAGLLLGHGAAGAAVLVWSMLNRCIESLAIGWGITRDPVCLRRPWLYAARDLLGFSVWCASYVSGKITWRAGLFELGADGRVMRTR